MRIDTFSEAVVKEKLEQFFSSGEFHQIVTANPEMLLEGRKHRLLKQVINEASLITADGFGIVLMAKAFLKMDVPRFTGTCLVDFILESTKNKPRRIFLLGGTGYQAELAAKALKQACPQALVEAAQGGSIMLEGAIWQENSMTIEKIRAFAPDVLLVGLGHGKQELWIHDHASLFPSVRIAMGVGGIFAFYSGYIARAPRLMQKFGFEWLWRLLMEPRRIGRIIRAVIIFPILLAFDTLRHDSSLDSD